MSIQCIKIVGMLDHDQIAIVIGPGTIDGFNIRSGKNHGPCRCCIHRRAEFIDEFHSGMRVTLPIGSGTIAIADLDIIVIGQMDGPGK